MSTQTNDVADVLDRAADLIEPAGRWIQYLFAEDANGNSCPAYDEDAVCFCARGAIMKAAGEGLFGEVQDAAAKLLGYGHPAHIAKFNDDPERTQAEVVAALRRAATLARAGAA